MKWAEYTSYILFILVEGIIVVGGALVVEDMYGKGKLVVGENTSLKLGNIVSYNLIIFFQVCRKTLEKTSEPNTNRHVM